MLLGLPGNPDQGESGCRPIQAVPQVMIQGRVTRLTTVVAMTTCTATAGLLP